MPLLAAEININYDVSRLPLRGVGPGPNIDRNPL